MLIRHPAIDPVGSNQGAVILQLTIAATVTEHWPAKYADQERLEGHSSETGPIGFERHRFGRWRQRVAEPTQHQPGERRRIPAVVAVVGGTSPGISSCWIYAPARDEDRRTIDDEQVGDVARVELIGDRHR